MSLRLISLDCPTCGSAMRGEGLDTIFFCTHCGGAAVLEGERVEPVRGTALLPAPGRSARLWRPAWRLEVEARVQRRIRAGGRETPGWQGRRVFFIPAFAIGLDDLTRLARALSEISEATAEVPREPIHGGVLAADDALTLVRHVLIGDEVRRSDMLASVEVAVELVGRGLIALPFERVDDRLRCAVTGLTVSADRG
ncbi:MAG: hypothetical protein MUC56_09505 [Thermoanaerobaculales bacterium]|jgi:hypothetical protein|nr:hypothetical protein [Thermoanaerobaculales bacterium]